MITSIHRPHPSLRCLLADEAAFIDAAFHCILPEARDEGLQVSASAYVDAKLAALLARDSAESDIDLRFYRAGIAEVQALCERTQGRRFQALPLWQQLSVLAQIDRPGDAPSSLRRCLLDLLLNDAAEAYFDVGGADVGAGSRRAASRRCLSDGHLPMDPRRWLAWIILCCLLASSRCSKGAECATGTVRTLASLVESLATACCENAAGESRRAQALLAMAVDSARTRC